MTCQAAGPSIVDLALGYAARGWYVLPLHAPLGNGRCTCGNARCESQGKHPRAAHGCKDATTDEMVLRRWLGAARLSNLGIATEPSRLLVVDIDLRNGGNEAWAELRRLWGWQVDDAFGSATGSGGRHLYWKLPEHVDATAIRSRSNALGPGVDIKCAGGYVVAPPSRHVSGRQYTWVANGIAEPLAVPEPLLEAILESQRTGRVPGPERPGTTADHSPGAAPARLLLPSPADSRGEQEPDRDPASSVEIVEHQPRPAIAVGARHEALKQAAIALRQTGLEPPAVRDAVFSINEKHCAEPLPLTELLAILAWTSEHVEPRGSAGRGSPFEEILLPDFMKIEFPEPKWIVPNLIPEGCTILAGPAKRGKSTTIHHVALAVAAGGYVFGQFPVEQGRTLYLSLEGGESLYQKRCRELLGGEEASRNFGVTFASRNLPDGALSDLESWIQRNPDARLIVVDTFVNLRDGGNELKKGIWRDDYDSVKGMSDLANAYGVGIVLLVHTTKYPSAEDPFNEITGTMGIQGAADTLIVMRGPRQSPESEIHAVGRRLEEPVKAKTRWNSAEKTISWLGDLDEAEQTGQQDVILAELSNSYPETLSPHEIETRCGIGGGAVSSMLSRLIRAGRVEKTGRASYRAYESREVVPV